jgi:hypothetical protein
MLPYTPASNGLSWMAVPSIASTAPGRRCWKDCRRTCARGIRLGFANLRTEVRALLERSGVLGALGDGALFATLKSAVDAWDSRGFVETSEAGTEPS